MSKKIVLGASTCALAMASALFFYVSNQEQVASGSNEDTFIVVANEGTVPYESKSISGSLNASQNIASPEAILESSELKEQISAAIQSYDEISQYPPNSQPIVSVEHVNSFVNSAKSESSLPFPFAGLELPIQLSIALDEYNYFYGETITAAIQLSELP